MQRENKRSQTCRCCAFGRIVITVVTRRTCSNALTLISSAFPFHQSHSSAACTQLYNICHYCRIRALATVIWVNLVRNLLLTSPGPCSSDPQQHKVYSAPPRLTTCCPSRFERRQSIRQYRPLCGSSRFLCPFLDLPIACSNRKRTSSLVGDHIALAHFVARYCIEGSGLNRNS